METQVPPPPLSHPPPGGASLRLIVMTSKNVTAQSLDSPAWPAICLRPGDGNHYLLYLGGKLCRPISVSSVNERRHLYLYFSYSELNRVLSTYWPPPWPIVIGLNNIPSREGRISPTLLSSTQPDFHFLLSPQTPPHSISVTRSTAPEITNFINGNFSQVLCIVVGGVEKIENISNKLIFCLKKWSLWLWIMIA